MQDLFLRGVFNLVVGPTKVGTDWVKDRRVSTTFFTGGVDAGLSLSGDAHATNKMLMELGGQDPSIVLADADVEAAAELLVNSCYPRNGGQNCNAVRFALIVGDESRVQAIFTAVA